MIMLCGAKNETLVVEQKYRMFFFLNFMKTFQ